MTENNTGTIINKAKIQDQESQAQVIISIHTGMVMYLSIGIVFIVMIVMAIILVKKQGRLKIGKISLFGAIIIVTICSGMNHAEAGEAPGIAEFSFCGAFEKAER